MPSRRCQRAAFRRRARSIEDFGAATQWAIALFMVLAGANFALMYRGFLRNQWRKASHDEELRVYFGLLALGSVLLFVELAAKGILTGEAAIRHGVFQAVSMMTTTGYASTDFNLWPIADRHDARSAHVHRRLRGIHGRRHQGRFASS